MAKIKYWKSMLQLFIIFSCKFSKNWNFGIGEFTQSLVTIFDSSFTCVLCCIRKLAALKIFTPKENIIASWALKQTLNFETCLNFRDQLNISNKTLYSLPWCFLWGTSTHHLVQKKKGELDYQLKETKNNFLNFSDLLLRVRRIWR